MRLIAIDGLEIRDIYERNDAEFPFAIIHEYVLKRSMIDWLSVHFPDVDEIPRWYVRDHIGTTVVLFAEETDRTEFILRASGG